MIKRSVRSPCRPGDSVPDRFFDREWVSAQNSMAFITSDTGPAFNHIPMHEQEFFRGSWTRNLSARFAHQPTRYLLDTVPKMIRIGLSAGQLHNARMATGGRRPARNSANLSEQN